jgi:hypothetical protein
MDPILEYKLLDIHIDKIHRKSPQIAMAKLHHYENYILVDHIEKLEKGPKIIVQEFPFRYILEPASHLL